MTHGQDDLYRQVVSAGVDALEPSAALRERVLRASRAVLPSRLPVHGELFAEAARPAIEPQRVGKLPSRWIRGGVAAAVAILVVGGIVTWSGRPEDDAWWMGPPAAWAQPITAALDHVRGVTCREQTVFILSNGTRHTSSTSVIVYVGEDSYRRDIYDDGELREVQWYTPDVDAMTQTSVRFDTRTYSALRHPGSFGEYDPVQRVRAQMRWADRAHRRLDTDTIEGRECVGFEIRASAYGDNPESWLDRVWFDIETKLPVRIEFERPGPGRGIETTIRIQEQFDWAPQLPADTFTPEVPDDFEESRPDGQSARP